MISFVLNEREQKIYRRICKNRSVTGIRNKQIGCESEAMREMEGFKFSSYALYYRIFINVCTTFIVKNVCFLIKLTFKTF